MYVVYGVNWERGRCLKQADSCAVEVLVGCLLSIARSSAEASGSFLQLSKSSSNQNGKASPEQPCLTAVTPVHKDSLNIATHIEVFQDVSGGSQDTLDIFACICAGSVRGKNIQFENSFLVLVTLKHQVIQLIVLIHTTYLY
jgi:hypothetical protein